MPPITQTMRELELEPRAPQLQGPALYEMLCCLPHHPKKEKETFIPLNTAMCDVKNAVPRLAYSPGLTPWGFYF